MDWREIGSVHMTCIEKCEFGGTGMAWRDRNIVYVDTHGLKREREVELCVCRFLNCVVYLPM